MTNLPSQFTDGILDASVNLGVARITLAQLGPDGKAAPSSLLLVPVMQLPALANGLLTLVQQIENKMKESQAQQAPVAPEQQPMPSAFTFGGR
jgi:hypothetical protein